VESITTNSKSEKKFSMIFGNWEHNLKDRQRQYKMNLIYVLLRVWIKTTLK